MIALINPVSTGADLADAFREEGGDCVHVYTREHRSSYEADTAQHRWLHTGIEETAERLGRAGVSTVISASEFGVTLACEIAARLGLPHHRPELRAARRHKHLMLEVLRAAGLPHATSAAVGTEQELVKVLSDWHTWPVVVKPVNSAGTDGCRVCPDRAAALEAFRSAAGARNLMGETNHEVVVQEYLTGTQYIVNTVSMDRRHLLTELYTERIDRIDGVPVLRHMVTRTDADEQEQELVDYLMGCLDALGIRDGAAHSEVMRTPHGPRLVEVNSRVMGPGLAPDPFHAAYGYSQQHLTVERHLRPGDFARRFTLPYAPARTLAKVLLRPHTAGVLEAVDGARMLRRMPGFHSVTRLPRPGDRIRDRLLTTGAGGVAYFVHEDGALLAEVLATLHELEDSGEFYRIRPDTPDRA